MARFKLLWLSDLHLEFANAITIERLFNSVREANPDAIAITGDLSTSRRIRHDLERFASFLVPVYFVPGNHDYYGGSFQKTDLDIATECERHASLRRLGQGEVMVPRPDLALVGHGGWGDCRAGLGSLTKMRMNDSVLIADLAGLDDAELFSRLNAMGDESARIITKAVTAAVQLADHVVILTHVPPFVQATQYEGKQTSAEFLPHFCNVALGDALLKLARGHPGTSFTVLAGHTHSHCEYRATSNLRVKVAGARYGEPMIADILYL